jgi:hypothetical protein
LNAKRNSKNDLLVWGICSAALFLLALSMPFNGHWITDGGNKLMVMENFLSCGSFAIQNPASAIDPENRFFPDAVFHFQKTARGIYSVFPPYFSLLTAPFYKFCGPTGKYILPLLGGAGALLILLGILRRWHLPSNRLLPAALIATPLAFYAVEFWEMTLGVLPVLGMFLLLYRGKDFWAGLLLAGGLWMRPEMFFFAAVTTVILILEQPKRAGIFAAGFTAGMLPYGIVQFLLFGNITGIHGATYADTSRKFLWNFYYYFFSCKGAALSAGLAAIMLGCAPHFRSCRTAKTILCTLAAAGSIVLLRSLLNSPQPVTDCIMTIGLFTTTPFVFFIAMNWRPLWNHPVYRIRLTARITFLYTLILPPLLTSADLGIIWGARHWLFLLPLLVPLAWFAARDRKTKLVLLILFLISAGFQIHGLRTQYRMRQNSVNLTAFLRENTRDVIVTDIFFLPMQTPELFRERRWLFVKNGQEMLDAVTILRKENLPFTVVRSQHGDFRRIGNETLAELLKVCSVPEKPQSIRLKDTDFLDMEIFQLVHR